MQILRGCLVVAVALLIAVASVVTGVVLLVQSMFGTSAPDAPQEDSVQYACSARSATLPDIVPEPLNSMIVEASEEWGTDPLALATIYHNENGWTFDREPPPPYGNGRPWTRSPVGAQGGLQFMPATFEAYKFSNPAHQPGNVMDLEDALYAAAHYLTDLGAKAGTPLGAPEIIGLKPTVLNAIVSYHSGGAFKRLAGRPGHDENGLGPAGRQYMREGYEAYRELLVAMGECKSSGEPNLNGWVTPIDEGSYVYSSPFGNRLHPIFKTWTIHSGADLTAACGTPIHAASDGTVRYVNRVDRDQGTIDSYWGTGLYVTLSHAGNIDTGYGHLSRIATGIEPGTKVKAGDVIAYVGTTGVSTGCHLHFMVITDVGVENGRRVYTLVDPEKFMAQRDAQLLRGS